MTKEDLKEMGRRVRSKRKEMGITQEELADRIGIVPSHMSDIENGKKNFGVKIFIRITEELQVSADWMLYSEIED